jgi:hypothetical protein
VLDTFSSKSMAPGAALDTVDERDVRSVQNEVVHIARWVRSGDAVEFARLSPFTIYSDRVTFGNGKTSREGDQALGSRTSNLDNTTDGSETISGNDLVPLADILDESFDFLSSYLDTRCLSKAA